MNEETHGGETINIVIISSANHLLKQKLLPKKLEKIEFFLDFSNKIFTVYNTHLIVPIKLNLVYTNLYPRF
ncbi:hypothetical protein CLW00_11126 [Mongoliibacter ruber]|uniref:Uncharacterized protein n=1 Tax=Mongoliibacter ruber TaxID=1750599 RepID=A0A2T0WGN7_9BACT|nr:hypothetical protein CLW00_11126 [Mongoliibacter ruber]